MATFISHSPEETAAFAERLAGQVRPGHLLALVGDLGAGKTQFVKGLARGLGVTEAILSPTFALVHSYSSGRLPLYHLDFYRLDGPDQILAAGLDEYFVPAGVTVIEWWDRWTNDAPPTLCSFHFEAVSPTERRITYDDPGA
jgi:tRNA threonylcarbamoyladenosine biosynthesis protein TsaE